MDERKNIQPEEFQDQDFRDTFGDGTEFQKAFEQGEPAPAEPVEAPVEAPAEEKPVKKGRPARKKGYGLFGIPHMLATCIWLAIILWVGVSLGRILWVCATDVLAFGREEQVISFTVEETDTLDDIAQNLKEAGLIRYPELFKAYGTLTDAREDISAGTFNLNTIYDYMAMVNHMSSRSSAREVVKVTIPEGYNCEQMFKLLEEKGVCKAEYLREYAANGELDEYWFLEGVERGDKYCLEGYLFPDTYNFYTNDDPERVLEKFLDAFDARFTDIMRERLVTINETFAARLAAEGHDQAYIDSHPITIREVVIIASMIEKESSGGEESYNVSSVIYNRLADASQPPYLNIDASVIYGLGGKIDPETGESIPLTQADLETDTPYNTYLHTGLTPGPISNPGQESLNAAVMPNETDYYYYALNPATGEHQFSKTYKEHLKFLDSLE